MKHFFIFLVSFSFLIALDPQFVLESADKFRAPFKQFAFDMKITSFENETVVDQYLINAQVAIEENGQTNTLIYFKKPDSVKKRKMLIADNYIWVLFPRTKNAVRLSPMQVLLGEVSNGDVASSNFVQQYDILKLEEAIIDNIPCYEIFLMVKKNYSNSTYYYVDLFVDKKTYEPKKALFYTNTHKLIKTAIYSSPIKLNKKDKFITKIEVFDGIDVKKHSMLEYLALKKIKIPKFHYSKTFLSRLKPLNISEMYFK